MVGGPSLVFTRKHVAGETRIRSHQYEDARLCRRILGYDANSLYPSTMMKEMPCGPGFVKSYDNPEAYTTYTTGARVTLRKTRLFLPRFSSCWATAPTASSSKPWSATPTPFTPVTRRRLTRVSARPDSRPSRRSVPHTRLSCERSRSTSTGHSKSESWSTSSRSSACSNSTMSSWTSTSTGGTSSSSRWTQTACTSLYPARGSRMPSALGTRPSSRRKRSVGWPGTSGATVSLGYSSSRRRVPTQSHFAASATT